MPEEMVVNRGTGKEKGEARRALYASKLEATMEQRKGTPHEQLAAPPSYWDVVAIGPFQEDRLYPGRVIEVGEEATVTIQVFLSRDFPDPAPGQNACDILTGHNDKIELFIFTSNMQTMEPVPELSTTHCIFTTPGQCEYSWDYVFTPQVAACLYEMNICARICNCNNLPLSQYSGFVRWVEDLDYDWIYGDRAALTFDHPIRFMVSDPQQRCTCVEPD